MNDLMSHSNGGCRENILHQQVLELEAEVKRYRDALEMLASNFNAIRSASQPLNDMIDSWHYIARAALEEKP